jgi:Fe-S-cluster containining protein
MMLSIEDITRLEKFGFSQDSFLRFNREGYALLRNRQGRCVFFNVQERRCDVYAARPSGCRVYPVVLDEEKGIIVDSICHAQATVHEQEKMRRGKRVVKLLEKIDSEVQSRRSK